MRRIVQNAVHGQQQMSAGRVVQAIEQLVAEFIGDGVDLLHRLRAFGGEHEAFGAPVMRIDVALHQSARFKIIENPNQACAFDADRLGQRDLRNPVAQPMQVEQRQPPGLTESRVAQPIIQQLAPTPRRFGEAQANASMIIINHHFISILIKWLRFKSQTPYPGSGGP